MGLAIVCLKLGRCKALCRLPGMRETKFEGSENKFRGIFRIQGNIGFHAALPVLRSLCCSHESQPDLFGAASVAVESSVSSRYLPLIPPRLHPATIRVATLLPQVAGVAKPRDFSASSRSNLLRKLQKYEVERLCATLDAIDFPGTGCCKSCETQRRVAPGAACCQNTLLQKLQNPASPRLPSASTPAVPAAPPGSSLPGAFCPISPTQVSPLLNSDTPSHSMAAPRTIECESFIHVACSETIITRHSSRKARGGEAG